MDFKAFHAIAAGMEEVLQVLFFEAQGGAGFECAAGGKCGEVGGWQAAGGLFRLIELTGRDKWTAGYCLHDILSGNTGRSEVRFANAILKRQIHWCKTMAYGQG